ncbi:MAG: hypothetical protein CEN88_194 [Candidatus Berkelbacteria bacterium Licking1014_2]|uniref:HTH arsR-type domain-containing protein n=1 Tax=Candidatus Berkelbacteria bacterium Licking1014_2 TaxID=2017146 RepID=A0A554LW42_9BACT|nr:MAG: hypothetical protein CEN88_194 [Candidatus Berkelbacteria bacterium Licking1014_2]
MNQKESKRIERYFKGTANHYRLRILEIISRQDGITTEKIAENLDANFKTISEHTRRLVNAGLINKKYTGRCVQHSLSPYGQRFREFIKTFQHS